MPPGENKPNEMLEALRNITPSRRRVYRREITLSAAATSQRERIELKPGPDTRAYQVMLQVLPHVGAEVEPVVFYAIDSELSAEKELIELLARQGPHMCVCGAVIETVPANVQALDIDLAALSRVNLVTRITARVFIEVREMVPVWEAR